MFYFGLQPRNFQDELASKLGLGGQIAKKRRESNVSEEDNDNWDTESIQENPITSAVSQKKKSEDTRSIASRRSTMSKTSKSKKPADTQSITSKKGKKKQASTKKKPTNDFDEGIFLLEHIN